MTVWVLSSDAALSQLVSLDSASSLRTGRAELQFLPTQIWHLSESSGISHTIVGTPLIQCKYNKPKRNALVITYLFSIYEILRS